METAQRKCEEALIGAKVEWDESSMSGATINGTVLDIFKLGYAVILEEKYNRLETVPISKLRLIENKE